MTDGPGAAVLYRNATGLEKAMADTDAVRQIGIDVEAIIDSWDPFKTRLENLPYLAWAMGVNYWDDNWSENTKRDWVARQWEFKSLRGTLGGIKMILDFAGRDVSPFGYHVIKATLPPQRVFAGPSLTPAQREEWLQALPQLRVWRVQEEGFASVNKAFLGGIGSVRLRDARFCFGGIVGRQAFLASSINISPLFLAAPISGTLANLAVPLGINIGTVSMAGPSHAVGFGTPIGRQRMGQTFVASSSILLSYTVSAALIGSPQDGLVASVFPLGTDGFPTGIQALETSTTIDNSAIGTSPASIKFLFSNLVSNLDVGLSYAVVITRTGSLVNSNAYSLQVKDTVGSGAIAYVNSLWAVQGTDIIGTLEFSGVALGRPAFSSWTVNPRSLTVGSPVFSLPTLRLSLVAQSLTVARPSIAVPQFGKMLAQNLVVGSPVFTKPVLRNNILVRGLDIGRVTVYAGGAADDSWLPTGTVGFFVATRAGQSFVAKNNSISSVTIMVRLAGSPTDGIIADIVQLTGTTQILIPEATSSNVVNYTALNNATFTPVTLRFATPVPLTIGTTYAVAISRIGASSNSNYYNVQTSNGSGPDVFPEGAALTSDATNWNTTTSDMVCTLQYGLGMGRPQLNSMSTLAPNWLTTSPPRATLTFQYGVISTTPLLAASLTTASPVLANPDIDVQLIRTQLIAAQRQSTPVGNPFVNTGLFTPPNNSLLVVILAVQGNGTAGAVSVTGGGLTFSMILQTAPQYQGGNAPGKYIRTQMWTAPVATGAPMAINVTDASTLTTDVANIIVSVIAFTGYNVSSPYGISNLDLTVGDSAYTFVITTSAQTPALSSQVIAWRARSDIGTVSTGATPDANAGWFVINDLSAAGGYLDLQVIGRVNSTSQNVVWTDTSSNPAASSWARHMRAMEFKRGA